jgi:hypothetical protein
MCRQLFLLCINDQIYRKYVLLIKCSIYCVVGSSCVICCMKSAQLGTLHHYAPVQMVKLELQLTDISRLGATEIILC